MKGLGFAIHTYNFKRNAIDTPTYSVSLLGSSGSTDTSNQHLRHSSKQRSYQPSTARERVSLVCNDGRPGVDALLEAGNLQVSETADYSIVRAITQPIAPGACDSITHRPIQISTGALQKRHASRFQQTHGRTRRHCHARRCWWCADVRIQPVIHLVQAGSCRLRASQGQHHDYECRHIAYDNRFHCNRQQQRGKRSFDVTDQIQRHYPTIIQERCCVTYTRTTIRRIRKPFLL